jgi:hypothetical protein
MTTIYQHTPHYTITPYYVYADIAIQDVKNRLAAAEIQISVSEQQNRIDNPIGTGAGGRVRLGDDTLPSTYLVSVRDEDAEKARRILVHNFDSFSRDRIVKILATDTKKDENLF